MKDLQIQLDAISENLNRLAHPPQDIGAVMGRKIWRARNDKPAVMPQPVDNRPMLTKAYKEDYRKFYFAGYQIVKDAEIARDLVHDAFIKAQVRADQFRGQASLSTYIFKIVVNSALDHVRSGKHKASVNGGAKDSALCEREWQPHDIVPKPFPGPLKALLLKEKLHGVQFVLRNMAPKKREVLVAYAVRGEKLKDIGGFVGAKLGTVLSRLNAAREDLRSAGLTS